MNTPERGTEDGALATAFVEARLKPGQLIAIKTQHWDKYDRYLADVFYKKSSQDPQDIFTNGSFLNKKRPRRRLGSTAQRLKHLQFFKQRFVNWDS